MESAVEFAQEICNLPPADTYTFDFGAVGRIEPFALLFLSSELQRCRAKYQASIFQVQGHEHCTYAAHMGFFKAFGLDHGKLPGEAKGSSRYIPVTIFECEQMRKDAAENFEVVGAFIERKAQEMAFVLSQQDSGDLFETLAYSIREIVRNVVEHSDAYQFGFCAQYWPNYHSVELAILDRGIGIKQGLSSNPNLKIEDDHQALNLALMPGISGNFYKGKRVNPHDIWANSGYGLYMTSRLCKEGGSFFIASGKIGLFLSEKKIRHLETPFEGTAIKMTLDTSRISALDKSLSRFRQEAKDITGNTEYAMTASKASLMLVRDFIKDE